MTRHTDKRHRAAPDNVVPFQQRDQSGRRKPGGKGPLFTLLSRIDELEDTLEIMDEAGVTTRDELEALIGQLEAEAATFEDDPGDT